MREKVIRFGPGKWRVRRDRELGVWWVLPPYGESARFSSWRSAYDNAYEASRDHYYDRVFTDPWRAT